MNNICLIITAYNRPEALERLLKSLLKIRLSDDEEIPLLISIDNGGTEEVNKVANSFEWPYGKKIVNIHKEKLGLVRHFIWTGDQTKDYENIIFLEDDLLVSPEIINYTKQVIDFYENDSRVAAASLYNPIFNEATGTRFYQIQDGFDAYFLQQPYWGHVWMREKWGGFKKYLSSYKENKEILPPNIASWKESFKKKFVQYLIETNKTVVTPRISLVTNSGTGGLHSGDLYHYQSELMIERKTYRFPNIEESKARYDSFEEIEADILKEYNPELSQYNFEVDINGLRNNYTHDYVLTNRPSQNAIFTYSSYMKPTELSVILGIHSDKGVTLSRKADIIKKKSHLAENRYKDYLKNYYLGVYPTLYLIRDYIKILFKRLFRLK